MKVLSSIDVESVLAKNKKQKQKNSNVNANNIMDINDTNIQIILKNNLPYNNKHKRNISELVSKHAGNKEVKQGQKGLNFATTKLKSQSPNPEHLMPISNSPSISKLAFNSTIQNTKQARINSSVKRSSKIK